MRALAVLFALLPFSVAAETILSAKYADPTDRYDHGVLGDAIEWGTLEVRLKGAKKRRFVLPQERVFEDLEPRVVDLDGDGNPEVITVESHIHFGARLSIWDADGFVTSNEWIGQRNRWLAPVGAIDIDKDGYTEIGFVDRPHLARELAIYRYRDRNLEFVISLLPFTNHKIGEDFITGGVRNCTGNRPEFIVASGDWKNVMAVEWANGQPRPYRLRPNRGAESFERALNCQ